MDPNQPMQPVEQSASVPTKKPLVRKSYIIGLYIIFSLVALAILSLRGQEHRKQIAALNSRPSPTPTYVYINAPSHTPTPFVQEFASNRQTVEMLVQKYLDSPQEKETYLISFDKITSTSKYWTTNDSFPTLVISDDAYEFSIQIPKDGGSSTFKSIPPNTIVHSEFGSVTRITNPMQYLETNSVEPKPNQTEYYYTTDFNTKCTQWSPIPPACSLLQTAINNKNEPSQKAYAYLVCKTSDQTAEKCDRLISTLEIDLK